VQLVWPLAAARTEQAVPVAARPSELVVQALAARQLVAHLPQASAAAAELVSAE
jgi:hypothetical protein